MATAIAFNGTDEYLTLPVKLYAVATDNWSLKTKIEANGVQSGSYYRFMSYALGSNAARIIYKTSLDEIRYLGPGGPELIISGLSFNLNDLVEFRNEPGSFGFRVFIAGVEVYTSPSGARGCNLGVIAENFNSFGNFALAQLDFTNNTSPEYSRSYSPSLSDHSNTGANPVVVETIGGYDATGSDSMPKDGSVWIDFGGAISSLNFDIDFRSSISNALIFDIDYRQSILGSVIKDVDIRNAVFAYAINDIDVRNKLYNSATSSLDIRNSILGTAFSDLDLRNKILNAAWFDVDIRNEILAVAQGNSIISDLDVRNSISNAVNADLEIRNKILLAIEVDIDFRNSILLAVTSDIDVRASVFQFVTNDIEISNKISGFVYSDLDIRNSLNGVRSSDSVIEKFTFHLIRNDFSIESNQKENYELVEKINTFTI